MLQWKRGARGPTYLRIEDENGNPLTSIHFLYGIPSPTYYVKTDATPVVLSVYPSMPYGISFYSSQGEFRGTPREYFPETTMTFTARNMLGNITCTIQLSVGDCQLGPLVTPHFVSTGSGILTLESEGVVYYNHTLGTDDPLRHVICLPPLEYTYSFTCTSRYMPCEVYLSDNSSNYYLSLYVIIGDTKSGFFELKPTRSQLSPSPCSQRTRTRFCNTLSAWRVSTGTSQWSRRFLWGWRSIPRRHSSEAAHSPPVSRITR